MTAVNVRIITPASIRGVSFQLPSAAALVAVSGIDQIFLQ